jgi:hypothetical protein
MEPESFTLKDWQDPECIQKVLDNLQRLFVELDGYYELLNVGRGEPLSREEFLKATQK